MRKTKKITEAYISICFLSNGSKIQVILICFVIHILLQFFLFYDYIMNQ